MVHKPYNIYYLALYGKNLPTPTVEYLFFPCMLPIWEKGRKNELWTLDMFSFFDKWSQVEINIDE